MYDDISLRDARIVYFASAADRPVAPTTGPRFDCLFRLGGT